jgi:hypothetical protein
MDNFTLSHEPGPTKRLPKSPKQDAILHLLRTSPTITLADAVAAIGDIYCNAEKHVGSVLSNMVNRGLIRRVKKGVYAR